METPPIKREIETLTTVMAEGQESDTSAGGKGSGNRIKTGRGRGLLVGDRKGKTELEAKVKVEPVSDVKGSGPSMDRKVRALRKPLIYGNDTESVSPSDKVGQSPATSSPVMRLSYEDGNRQMRIPAGFFQRPRLSTFSGDDTRKGDVSFDLWKYEVECLRNDNVYSPDVLVHAVRASLKGDAGLTVMHLGVNTSIDVILEKLEVIYGEVETGAMLLESFYRDSDQRDGETVAAYSSRLQLAINKVKLRGGIREELVDETLRTVFWRKLADGNLKSMIYHKRDQLTTFDELVRMARSIEQELKGCSVFYNEYA